MSLNILLDQVLKIAKKTGAELGSKAAAANNGNNPLGSPIKALTGGMALNALANLFGKKSRSSGSSNTLMKVGSAAALGALAYQAYKAYSASQPAASTPAQADFLNENSSHAEQSSRVILRAMIAAAASDGAIDEQERALIVSESSDAATQQWLAQEMAQPANAADIAREVGGNQALAAEVYLAARMVCGDLARKEIVFLAQLSDALNLDDKLIDALEKQADLAA